MNEERKIELYDELRAFYGAYAQAMLCIEEMSELTKEILKHQRGCKNEYEIAEEVADVEIMIEQLKRIFALEDEVENWRLKKLRRTRHRLEIDKALIE